MFEAIDEHKEAAYSQSICCLKNNFYVYLQINLPFLQKLYKPKNQQR